MYWVVKQEQGFYLSNPFVSQYYGVDWYIESDRSGAFKFPDARAAKAFAAAGAKNWKVRFGEKRTFKVVRVRQKGDPR